MDTELKIELEFFDGDNGKICLVKMIGTIDAYTASIAEKSLNTIIEQGCYNVIVDFKELEYMSSAGFGVLVAILDVLMLKTGNMIILNLSPKLNKIFTYLGLINIFKVFDDKIQALTHLGAKL